MVELHSDQVLDVAATVITTPQKAERRDRARDRADDAGLESCEICGRGILDSDGALQVRNTLDGSIMYFGPTCARKLRKSGLLDAAE